MDLKIDYKDLPTTLPDSAETETQFNRFSRFYDDDYRDYDADLEMIAALAEDCGNPILELGCGTGRALLYLANRGLNVTGVDISPELLAHAQAKAKQAALTGKLSLAHGDIRSFDLSDKGFQFAYCVSNTLMHCTTLDDQFMALQSAHRHLVSGGLFLVDLFNPDLVTLSEVSGLQEFADSWENGDGNEVLKWSIRTVDAATQCQDTCFIYEEILPDGTAKKTVCPFTLRFLWPSEGQLLLEKAGFDLVATWGDFDGEPHHSASERLIFLARKP